MSSMSRLNKLKAIAVIGAVTVMVSGCANPGEYRSPYAVPANVYEPLTGPTTLLAMPAP
jgi:hypothetical protein